MKGDLPLCVESFFEIIQRSILSSVQVFFPDHGSPVGEDLFQDIVCYVWSGHTVVVKDVAYKLRLLPSGILYKGKTCFLGNGVVINPGVVLKEIADMKA